MRNFTQTKRIVIKIGTNTLTRAGRIDSAYVRRIARQITTLKEQGKQIVIVSSGAIGMGATQMGITTPVMDVKMRQACAAVGQPLLLQDYRKAFAAHRIEIAQVLLTTEVLNNRKTYLNLRNSVETLLKIGAIPIMNENDSVSTEEIGSAFGDNDKLSALVASKIDADLLIMLSDIDALYEKDPRKFPEAKPISVVYEISEKIVKSAGKRGTALATGGMQTKIQAAKIASYAGCRIVLANGRARNVIPAILAGRQIGTIFMPKRKLGNRQRWILNTTPAGTIRIDPGAMKAVRGKKSLLPSGILSTEGVFDTGAVVMLNDTAKAVTSLGSSELKLLAGKHSSEIRQILGSGRKDVVAVPEDIVFLED